MEHVNSNNNNSKTWHDMESMVQKDLVREIGICNFNTALIRQVCNTAIILPRAIQIERHPLLIQSKLLRCCREAGMEIMAFSPLGGRSYIPLDMAHVDEDLLNCQLVYKIALSHKKSPAQILLRWSLQSGTTPICKTSSLERLEENLNVLDFQLKPSEMNSLNGMDIGRRFNDPGEFTQSFGCFCPIYD